MKSAKIDRIGDGFTTFPMLGISDGTGCIVLFTDAGTGVCVFQGDGDPLGDLSDAWSMDSFTPYTGKVILEN